MQAICPVELNPLPNKNRTYKLQPNSKKTVVEGMKRHTHCRKLYVQQLYRIQTVLLCSRMFGLQAQTLDTLTLSPSTCPRHTSTHLDMDTHPIRLDSLDTELDINLDTTLTSPRHLDTRALEKNGC